MCGRYLIDIENDVEELENVRLYIESRLGKKETQRLDGGEIFPSNYVPVILTAPTGYIAWPMIWGFPSPKGKQLIINARSETVCERPMFRGAMQRGRCIIPTCGFYEWSHDANGKAVDKYLFRTKEDKMLYLAGLYRKYEDGFRFVILTRAANALMAEIHDRMPVVVDRSDLADYVNNEVRASQILMDQDPVWVRTLV